MQPTAEINSFIARIAALPAGPGISLDAALHPSVDEEAELRKLFATDRQNSLLANPHVGLVDVFDAPDSIRTTRARVVQGKEDRSAKHVMPLSEENRRKEGTPSTVADLEEFKKNWAIFTEGSLSQLVDWNNVVAAGGSVLACLTPLEQEDKISKRVTRKHYHSNAYPTSDVDLFLWGMTPEQAELKIKTIYEAVRDSVPWDVTCIRTKHTVSIHSQYPYRSVQIVLRLYQSPAEILAGFDIDAPCCAYDGNRVWANPRSIVAMMRQCNTVDMTRRSPSYEIRLSKYSQRSFEVYVPTLQRDNIDPTIFERSIARMEGLARLLVLEKLTDDNMRTAFLEGRRTLRGRPNASNRYSRRNKRKYKGDLKVETGIGIEMNDYDVASLHIPYGPGWDAKRIDKLVYQTDLGMNSTFNPKNKGRRLHRHPAFFGTVEECLEDCCEHCPKPIDTDEKKLQEEEDEMYIRGRIKFVEENPGRQSISGSFNPIDVGEWSEQVYVRPTQRLFSAIASHDRAAVQKVLQEGTIDLNNRDHVGRTTLHVAIFAGATDIACDLIDAGARITARLADGRAPLHLAAQYDQTTVIKKLLEKNKKNIEEAEKKKTDDDDDGKMEDTPERPSSEDDWSSHDDEDVEMSETDDEEEEQEDEDSENETGNKQKTKSEAEQPAKTGEIPDDSEEDQPDIIEIDVHDWDLGFTAFSYAVLFASVTTLEILIAGGADPKLATNPNPGQLPLHPLTLTILRDDEDEACKIAERLLQISSVTSSTANQNMVTILHAAVSSGRTNLVETILRCDKNANSVINFPAIQWNNVIFPVVTAIHKKHYAILGTMLAHGAKLSLDEEDITRALEAATPDVRQRVTSYGSVKNYLQVAYQPLEAAVQNQDDIANLLIALGAGVDFGLKHSLTTYSNIRERRTLKDWVDFAVVTITHSIELKEAADMILVNKATDVDNAKIEEAKTGWKAFYEGYTTSLKNPEHKKAEEKRLEQTAKSAKEELERLGDIKEFLLELQSHLEKRGAKTWEEAYPAIATEATLPLKDFAAKVEKQVVVAKKERDTTYVYLGTSSYYRQNVPEHLNDHYDELFEACFAGDNDKIQRLCLPVEGQNATLGQNTPPLNISVRMVDGSISRYDKRGYTPLFAAISARRWATAKFVLAVATAQYHPEDEQDKIKFDIDVDTDDDSDNDSCASDDSDETVERPEFKFIDIATRPSAVQANIHPKTMLLNVPVSYLKILTPTLLPATSEIRSAIPLVKAIVDHDLEAFVQVANLYQSLAQPLELGKDVLSAIIADDQPDILDEYIRRTGAGINVEGARKQAGMKEGEGELPVVSNDGNRLYLGLNVHGKKRMDLASKNDPNATTSGESNELPLVWHAAKSGAKDIVNYLASDRPFSAYKFYATTHSDPKAIWFRRLLGKKDAKKTENNLESRLPAWLGWNINSLGESPLAAAIIGGNVEVVKLIAKLEPGLVAQALQTKIKFVGLNPLMLALCSSSHVKIVEYLLSRKVAADERDLHRGWNIYHYICEKNSVALLDLFLKKLPRDTNEMLLAQQSTGRLNTPLHIAVKRGYKRVVEIILGFTQSTLLKRDIDGQTPLHCAAKAAYIDITRQLLAASPPEVLHMEDSVGRTPLEIVNLAEIHERLRKYNQNNDFQFQNLSPSSANVTLNPLKLTLQKVEEELKEIREGVEFLFKDGSGKVVGDIKMATLKWAEETQKKVEVFKENLQRAKDEEELKRKLKGEPADPPVLALQDSADHRETSSFIRATLASRSVSLAPASRQLIHLFDVQQSVNATLAKVGGKLDEGEDYSYTRYRYRRRNRDEGELEEEEDEDKKARRMSMVFQYLVTGADPV